MNIVNPHLLFLLVLLLPLIWLLAIIQKRYRRRFERFADSKFWSYYLGNWSYFFLRLKMLLLLLAFGMIIIGLARPQWDLESQDIRRSGLDIAICIDVSKSMDATDITPTRLERAKDQISAFIDEQKGDRIALIPFAGIAYVQCPLTDDYEAVKMLLSSLNSNSVPVWGTNIGKALFVASSVFDKTPKTKAVILISDGEDLGNDAVKQSRALAQKGIVVYTMGVGTPGGATVRIDDDEMIADVKQREITTRLDNKTLEKIATVTGGEFYMITPAQEEIQAILRQISSRERGKLSALRVDLFKEQYHIFAVMALLLILAEALLSAKVKRNNSHKINGSLISAFILFILLAAPAHNLHSLKLPWSKAYSNSKGRAAYDKQDYRKAEQIFGQNLQTYPREEILHYNKGNALYKLNKKDEAANSWREAGASQNDKLRSKAMLNLGNVDFKQQRYAEAMESYRKAIYADYENESAKLNYELAKRMLLKQQNKQSQPKPDNAEMDKPRKTDKQETAERILKALEQKEINDRKSRQQSPQRTQNDKWW